MTERADVLIAGAGIAGSALAFELAGRRRVVLLEREAQPGYHSTGRSAAMLTETYGTAAVRALAGASRPFLERPPEGFAAHPLLEPRGMLHVARADQLDALAKAEAAAAGPGGAARRLDRDAVVELAPLLDPGYVEGGLFEPDSMAIDVAALHQGYLRGLRARGGRLVSGAGIEAVERRGGRWHVQSRAGAFEAEVLVDAAGAWADELARLAGIAPIGLVPTRRTAVLLEPPAGMDPMAWPMVIDVEERFYVKPESGRLLVSPADETPVEPSDVQPEELDVALAVDRYERATGRSVQRVGRRWAGLRSFVSDHDPVLGPDPDEPGFVWLAALGGFGIMTAPALAQALAHRLLHGAWPSPLGAIADAISPHRLAGRGTT